MFVRIQELFFNSRKGSQRIYVRTQTVKHVWLIHRNSLQRITVRTQSRALLAYTNAYNTENGLYVNTAFVITIDIRFSVNVQGNF